VPSRLTEKQVRDPVVAWFKARGGLHERNHKGKGAATGWPDDRFYFGSGHCYIVEFKRPGGTTTARQEYIIKLLRDAGHDVDIHDQSDEAIRALSQRMGAFGGAGISSRTPHP
jgi:hypothetical protein